MISSFDLYKVRSCLKYHVADRKRKELFTSIYSGKFDHASRDQISDLCLLALKTGCTTGIYGLEHQVIGVTS